MFPSALHELQDLLGPSYIRTDPQSLLDYGRDWTRIVPAHASAIVFPASAEDVRLTILWARRHHIALVPSGGRTGLSGGALADNGQVVVSADRLNRIISLNPVDRTLRVGAGVTVKAIQDHASQHGLYYPIDFAPAATMHIGGNISTNAGGIHVVRYGSTRSWIASIQAVTGAGEIVELGSIANKDNAGYDLKQLVIGAEGTLAIVTEATVRLTRKPFASTLLVFGVEQADAMLKLFQTIAATVPLLAFEFIDDGGMQTVLRHKAIASPLPWRAPYYILCDLELRSPVADDVLQSCLKSTLATFGLRCETDDFTKSVWSLRMGLAEAMAAYSPYKNDVSVPTSKVAEFLVEAKRVLGQSHPDAPVLAWGHLGDGNIHINILKPPQVSVDEFIATCRSADSLLYALVQKFGGSISAEHGVGILKKHSLHFTRSPAEVQLMRGIKKVFDPDGILNPGKIFDPEPQRSVGSRIESDASPGESSTLPPRVR